ncbi:uncharacterized protein Z519_00563 [Cladophialophora bantiana CBS 173.52]|uniref:Peroxidase n=1 Tax=Cladophialophora bantiana (strain ATCC 10958 / CBS 173.52 / CDC B-1940 / NIH 8579) TaxID=1442370 RepID=A0A0D2I6J7_CLAB1|nr:uncharacterized protein Z519_00563 [Cladophialophora bantiana CBS 173.52]KIW98900.1 hypothetical protein Z519_00563 [Cladophialophora bantiana CBS 173.52]
MLGKMTLFLSAAVGLNLIYVASSAATWPSPAYDEMEDLMLLNSGVNARNFPFPVAPCTFAPTPGHSVAGGFLRTAFHDMAPADVAAGTGGLDASIGFELLDPYIENTGPAFNASLTYYSKFFSSRASMSDLIALGVYASVRACGGPAVPLKAGRIDATQAGAVGVPDAKDDITKLTRGFARMGFSPTEMIQVVACGHTLGGVHSAEHPTIVPANTTTLGVQNFDATNNTYDNLVITKYLDGSTKNPLVIGPDLDARSDLRVFASDDNQTVSAMQTANSYADTCTTILAKMLDTVPSSVTLTDTITPYPVKPVNLQLNVASGGDRLIFSGQIRFWTNTVSASSISSLKLVYKDRLGAGSESIDTLVAGDAAGFDDTFTFFNFSSEIPAKSSISSFTVVVTTSSGTVAYDNNGEGFPVSDTIFAQTANSIVSSADSAGNSLATIVAAVRYGTTGEVDLTLSLVKAMTYNNLPTLVKQKVTMAKVCESKYYTFYMGSYSLPAVALKFTKYDVTVGSSSDSFKGLGGLSASASALSCSGVSYSTTSTSISTTSTASTVSISTKSSTSSTASSSTGSYSSQLSTTWASSVSTATCSGKPSTKWPHRTSNSKTSITTTVPLPVSYTTSTTTESVSYTVTIVTSFETYCPYATKFSYNDKWYTAIAATTITITDCLCTISAPWTSKGAFPTSAATTSTETGTSSTSTGSASWQWSTNGLSSESTSTSGTAAAAAATSTSGAGLDAGKGSGSESGTSVSPVSPAIATFTGAADVVSINFMAVLVGAVLHLF